MITIRNYAEKQGVSYEAIRQQVNRYAAELEGHITKRNRTQFLDEYAEDFLDEKRRESVVGVIDTSTERELQSLREQVSALKDQLIIAQKSLIDSQQKQVLMAEAAAQYAGLLEAHTVTEQELDEVKRQRDQAAAEAAERIRTLEAERDSAVTQARSYTPSIFGFYRKK